MELAVLGPVEARGSTGAALPLGPPQRRAVLAVLAIELNRVVSVERLADLIWSGDPPPSARNALQVNVSHLRRLLAAEGPVRLETRPPGYMLEGDPSLVDLHRWRSLLDRAAAEPDDERKIALLGAALELWRGDPLSDLDMDGVRQLSASWVDARWTAVEDRIDAELRLGRFPTVLAQLPALLAEQPLRERLTGQHMTALAASGRPAEAVETYHALRDRLVSQLGVEPGPALRALFARLLRNEASASFVVPAQLPPAVGRFVGRSTQLDRLDGLRAEALRHNYAALTLLVGPGGIGKTALAVAWSHRVRGAYPDGQLYVDLRGYTHHQPRWPDDVLAAFLRSLGASADAIPRTVDERASLYRSMLAGRRMLVVLDNASSSAQVRPLLPGAASCLTLVTSRNRLDGLVARDGAQVVPLPVLTDDEAFALLAEVAGADLVRAQPTETARLAELCDRLPLALRIAGARLGSGRAPADLVRELDDARQRLSALSVESDDSEVRSVLATSYRVLPAPVARLLRRLGDYPGQDWTVLSASALVGAPAGPLLEALVADHLVVAANSRFGMHDLVRLVASERSAQTDDPAERRSALQRLLHWYLHSADRADLLLYPTRLVPAPTIAAPQTPIAAFGDVDAAFAWLDQERVNLLAAARAAFEAELYTEVWQLANALTTYLRRRYLLDEHIELHTLGMRAAALDGNPPAEVVMARGLGVAYSFARQFTEAIAAYQHAIDVLDTLDDPGQLGLVETNIGCARLEMEQYEEAEADLLRGLALLTKVDAVQAIGVTLSNLGLLYRRTRRLDEARDYLERALEIAQRLDHKVSLCNIYEDLGGVAAATGDHEAAVAHLRNALAVTREIGDHVVQVRVLRGLATSLLRAGDRAGGRRRLDEALALAASIGGPLGREVQRDLDGLLDEQR
jgi:DNA-binding SARP family transcriptional activator/tetratricopeptide (TPR) repeat protein